MNAGRICLRGIDTLRYEGRYRLISAVETGATTNSYSYDYDRAGNRISQTVNGVTSRFTYNAANQRSGLSYDAAGNLLHDGTTTYRYDALHRLITQGGINYTSTGDNLLAQRQ